MLHLKGAYIFLQLIHFYQKASFTRWEQERWRQERETMERWRQEARDHERQLFGMFCSAMTKCKIIGFFLSYLNFSP